MDETTGETTGTAAWERRWEWPLTAAAVAFLAAYAIPILYEDAPAGLRSACQVVTWVTWALFGVDYLVRLALSDRRWRFFKRHLLDLLVLVLPMLRPLRLLRLVTLLTVLNRRARGSLRGRVVVYVVGSTLLLLFLASLAMLDAERGAAGATIDGFGDAVWWAITTMTTVGYGDQVPVTGTGRLVAGGLMIAGIALLGTITATLASWLIDRVSDVEEAAQTATRRDIDALAQEIAALRAELAASRRWADGPSEG